MRSLMSHLLLLVILFSILGCAANISQKVEKITPGKTNREQVIEVFGRPDKYGWGEETFLEEDLPDGYIMFYDEVGINFAMYNRDTVGEVRVGSNKDYSYEGKIQLGSSLEDVISFFGEPSETIVGKPINWHTNRILYKDVEGKTGNCYIYYGDIGIRMLFRDYKVRGLYLRVPGTTP